MYAWYTWFGCVMAADFITGLIHWFEDTYITPEWPILGKYIGKPNVIHHQHPGWIAYMSTLISRNYVSVLPAILVCLLIIFWYGWIWPILFILLLSSLGNEVHTWNHRSRSQNPVWIRLLQDTAIIQTPQQHARHHRKPYTTCYCTLTNILNPILDYTRFWRGIEWSILVTTGIKPARGSQIRGGV